MREIDRQRERERERRERERARERERDESERARQRDRESSKSVTRGLGQISAVSSGPDISTEGAGAPDAVRI
jgi:hypothetical protein